MPKYVFSSVPFSKADHSAPPPPTPPPSTFHCKLRADLACIGARNAALYSRCTLRLDELQRLGLPDYPIVHTRPALKRAASWPNLLKGLADTPRAPPW